MKECRTCKETKPESEFHKRSNGVYYNQCKECKRAYDRERHYRMSENIQWRIQRSERTKKRYHANKHKEVTNEKYLAKTSPTWRTTTITEIVEQKEIPRKQNCMNFSKNVTFLY